jgi:hypothetical protein
VCIKVLFQQYFKICLFSHKTFEASWQIIENFVARIVCAFLKHVMLAIGLCRWCLFLVFTQCIAELVSKCSRLFITKFNNENIYIRMEAVRSITS